MEKKMNLHVSIPHEIVLQIFSWLPVKSLMRFKCVSGFCNSLVSKSDFLDIHRCRSMTCPGGTKFILHESKAFYAAEQEEDGNISASLFQTERFIEHYDDHAPANSHMNCANGLFCVWEPSSVRPAVIFNPTTREVRSLPDPNRGSSWCNYLLGFEPEENKYKVFLSSESQREYTEQWVLTLGVDKSWREIQSVSPYIPFYKPSVCISGVIYQFVRGDKCAIAAFDVKSEKFEIIALWNASNWLYYYNMVDVKGKLAVVDYRWVSSYFDLWILEQAPKIEWQKHFIQFPSTYRMLGPLTSGCTSYDGKIVFIRNIPSVSLKLHPLCWCYDVITRSWRKLEIEGLPDQETFIQGIYSYVEALDRCI